MLKKAITYKNFNDEEVTEDFYFNLSEAELSEKMMIHNGDYGEYLRKVAGSGDGRLIISVFKDLVLNSYGIKSEDGRKFVKNREIARDFESTNAYSTLFMELITNPEKMAEFFTAIMPKDLASKLDAIAKEQAGQEKLDLQESNTVLVPRVLTRDELIEMDHDLLKSGLASGRLVLGK